MALATRCPSCKTLFRVAADQLRLRGGLVRCGECQHVFDAMGTLSYVDDATLSTHAASPAAVGTVIAAIRKAEAVAGGEISAPLRPPAATASLANPQSSSSVDHPSPAAAEAIVEPAVGADAGTEPAGSMNERRTEAADVDLPPGENRADAPAPVELDQQAVTAATPIESTDATEPPAARFLEETDRAKSRRPSAVTIAAGAVLLGMLLLAQVAVVFRSELLARFPQARPALGQLCKVFRCTVNWPARADLLAVVGTELQALPGSNAFELTAIVRNRGQMTVALPAIELTLTDTLNRTVARKVFAPTDYLTGESDPQAHLLAGLEPGADLAVRIAFEASGVNAAGFVVYPFYL